MFSATNSSKGKTAAWRISLWGTMAFALGTVILFVFLHSFVSNEIQRRSDSWLTGEVGTLGDVAERTPKGALYDRIVEEVAELASKEVPHEHELAGDTNQPVFFLQTDHAGALKLWVGKGRGQQALNAIQKKTIIPDNPVDISIAGFAYPFRVASMHMDNGDWIYLGLSERDESLTLRTLRLYFFLICIGIVLLGFFIVFFSTRRMLGRVKDITEAAAKIGQDDLRSRVPETAGQDEISRLALTLNGMLDRIENTVKQLHTITDSLAHDLRSPMTAMRGKLETALLEGDDGGWAEPVAAAVDELDRLCEFLTKSLDVAEANADALRLHKETLKLDELLHMMVDLYEPNMAERGIRVTLYSSGEILVAGDQALIHRMMANIFDNELKHLKPGCSVNIHLRIENNAGRIVVEDDGPGFPEEVAAKIFEKYAKGHNSTGSGLGLAFVEAVVRAHDGSIEAHNLPGKGIRLTISLPLAKAEAGVAAFSGD
ncbi:MAG TPA: ATP-binding protein [Acidobacteriaceae bacterium]|nr:ATP-binding protein [Acidobacteriaceae bacterium]